MPHCIKPELDLVCAYVRTHICLCAYTGECCAFWWWGRSVELDMLVQTGPHCTKGRRSRSWTQLSKRRSCLVDDGDGRVCLLTWFCSNELMSVKSVSFSQCKGRDLFLYVHCWFTLISLFSLTFFLVRRLQSKRWKKFWSSLLCTVLVAWKHDLGSGNTGSYCGCTRIHWTLDLFSLDSFLPRMSVS